MTRSNRKRYKSRMALVSKAAHFDFLLFLFVQIKNVAIVFLCRSIFRCDIFSLIR